MEQRGQEMITELAKATTKNRLTPTLASKGSSAIGKNFNQVGLRNETEHKVSTTDWKAVNVRGIERMIAKVIRRRGDSPNTRRPPNDIPEKVDATPLLSTFDNTAVDCRELVTEACVKASRPQAHTFRVKSLLIIHPIRCTNERFFCEYHK